MDINSADPSLEISVIKASRGRRASGARVAKQERGGSIAFSRGYKLNRDLTFTDTHRININRSITITDAFYNGIDSRKTARRLWKPFK